MPGVMEHMYAPMRGKFQYKSRIENNLEMMGRLSEVYWRPRPQMYNDLELRLIYDTAAAIAGLQTFPGLANKIVWMQQQMESIFYLFKHPEVKP
jgi:hypothetical protein